MEVKSIMYKRLIRDMFYYQKMLSSEKMDDRIAQMLNKCEIKINYMGAATTDRKL